jgi:hypothetical protein
VRGYPRELVVLALVAATALAFVIGDGWQDVSRLGLTQSVAFRGALDIDPYADQTGDRAHYGGHTYSDKAPGMAFLALPALGVLRVVGAAGEEQERRGVWHWPRLLWLVRIASGGIAFLAAVFLVGRIAERLRPGFGAATAATLGLGTLALPLAATMFGHLAAGTLALGGFALAWFGGRRGWTLAAAGGLCGLGVLFEYQTAAAAAATLVYVVHRTRDPRAVAAFLAGAVPPALLLGAYDWAAFGSPLRLSYRYVDEQFIAQQREGLFGIGVPTLHGLRQLVVGRHGLLVETPVLAFAAAGLGLLWRRGLRAEAAVCAFVTLAFTAITAGFFDPYGGLSPGPRYFVPALPFLCLGLAEAFARWPRATTLAALYSSAAMLLNAGTWWRGPDFRTVWSLAGAPRNAGIALVVAPALAAVTLALRPALRPRAPATPAPPNRRTPDP